MTYLKTNEFVDRIRSLGRVFISFFSFFFLIRYNESIALSVLSGIRLCVTSIIPSIFPFFIFADYLGAHTPHGVFSKIISRILGTPEVCSPAITC